MSYVLTAVGVAVVVMVIIVAVVLLARWLLKLALTWHSPHRDPPLRLERPGSVRERLHSEASEAEPPKPAA